MFRSLSLTRRAFAQTLLAAPFVVAMPRDVLGAAPDAVCVLTPEQEEGPFYLAGRHVRSAIAEGKPGLPLLLQVHVMDAKTCSPVIGAAVDIWQCDALGSYSGFDAIGGPPGGRPPTSLNRSHLEAFRTMPAPPMGRDGHGPPAQRPTNRKTFLRGTQITNGSGVVAFTTIFPGYYRGRVNHIHLKVHAPGRVTDAKTHVVHTGQIFFPEQFARDVSASQPYAGHHIHRTTLREDGVYTRENASTCIARVERASAGNGTAVARLVVTVDRRADVSVARRISRPLPHARPGGE